MFRSNFSFFVWKLLTILICTFYCCQAIDQKKGNGDTDSVTTVHQENANINQKATFGDSVEAFFRSKGVLVFKATDKNLNKSFELLNKDGSSFATLNIGKDEIGIEGKRYQLSDFSNQKNLRQQYDFFPKEFYPDHSVMQFEYLSVKDKVAEVLIDKEKGVKKYIRIGDGLFDVEQWKEHFQRCMIDFDVKNNPIKENHTEASKSIGYENSGNDYIFLIREITGDWIKIECADICGFACEEGKKFDGWIKWKEGDKLLIRLLYAC